MFKTNKNKTMVRQLYKALTEIKSEEEGEQFFSDLCTIAELNALAQRLEVARLLREGNTYDSIENITGASTATISRVKRSLNKGSGGYQKILNRI